jgi:hypothetical protein
MLSNESITLENQLAGIYFIKVDDQVIKKVVKE